MATIAVAAVLVAVFTSVAEAAFPGANGRIAYVGAPPGEDDSELFTILPDGSGIEQLTDDLVNQDAPAWSPDGRELSLAVLGLSGGSTVFTMNADGSEMRALARSRTLASPSFSPSGRRILYTNGRAIKTIRTDGSDRRKVVKAVHRGILIEPQFSPDGRWIVFVGTPQGERRQGIWKVRRNGKRLRRLTGNVNDRGPDLSPDGRRIAFERAEGLWLMRANGKDRHPIPNTSGYNSPAFAPAGDRIATSRTVRPTPAIACSDIYTIRPDGSDPRQLTHNTDPGACPISGTDEAGTAGSPAWQPVPVAP
ncbi:MAG: TolB family protein [Solirubrobacterales bacterium]